MAENTFKVASMNVNSIRARLDIVLNWLSKEQPDLLCVQETKVQDAQFPQEQFAQRGYHAIFAGRKSYNGVAIFSKTEAQNVKIGLDEWGDEGEARLIAAKIKGINVVNVYVPQGREVDTDYFTYKLAWLKNLRKYLERYYTPDEQVICLGDFNVAPEAIDVYDHNRLLGRVGHHPEEQKALKFLQEWGLEDVFRRHVPEGGHYTFWDYRVKNALERGMGWKIDHIWVTKGLAEKSVRAWIDTSLRKLPKPSDHTAIIAEFRLR